MKWRNKRKGKTYIGILVIGLMGWFMVHTTYIILDGLQDELHHTDMAVVLGNKVQEDGRPSERLQARLDKAVDLYQKDFFETILVSGGVGEEGFDEAKIMKEYLQAKGIPKEQILQDSEGYNTYQTAENTQVLMEKSNMDSVMIITQYFHITRTELAFQKVGVNNISSAHAEIFELRDVYSILREFPAYYKYLVAYE